MYNKQQKLILLIIEVSVCGAYLFLSKVPLIK